MGTAREHGITTLYKYQPTLEHLENNLRDNHIYCSNPDGFNDPWDCKPYFDLASVDDPEQRPHWIEFYRAQFTLLEIAEQEEVVRDLGPRWYENDDFLRRCITRTTKEVIANHASRFRIFCLCGSNSSLLMWAHYADKHKGYCVEFDATKDKLRDARRVTYADRLPPVTGSLLAQPELLSENQLLTKSREWSYEDEYRLIARENDPTFTLPTERNFLKLPVGAVTAIIAGARANLTEIRAIIRRVAPGLPIKRAIPRPDEYRLDIVDDFEDAGNVAE